MKHRGIRTRLERVEDDGCVERREHERVMRTLLRWIRTGLDDDVLGGDALHRCRVARIALDLLRQPAHRTLLGLDGLEELTRERIDRALRALGEARYPDGWSPDVLGTRKVPTFEPTRPSAGPLRLVRQVADRVLEDNEDEARRLIGSPPDPRYL